MDLKPLTVFSVVQRAVILRRGFRRAPRCKLDFCSSEMLLSVNWHLVTDVLGQPIGSIFKGKSAQITLFFL
jgi:hypothetical protein